MGNYMRIENDMPEEMETVTTTTCTDGEGWVFDASTGMQIELFGNDTKYHDKIARALRGTHYVKKGKLFRIKWELV